MNEIKDLLERESRRITPSAKEGREGTGEHVRRRQRHRRSTAFVVATCLSALAGFGLWHAFHPPVSEPSSTVNAMGQFNALTATVVKVGGQPGVRDSLTINRGSSDGIRAGMAVMQPSGLVGRVLHAAPHAAVVQLLTDPGTRLKGLLLGGGLGAGKAPTGEMLSRGNGALLMRLGVPNKDVQSGTIAYTTDAAGLLPPGIPVGTVSRKGAAPLPSMNDVWIAPSAAVFSNGPAPRSVLVVLSSRGVLVPDASGKTVTAAYSMFRTYGLIVSHLSAASSSAEPRRQVLTQSPPPGSVVGAGTKVRLVLSAGPGQETTLVIGCDRYPFPGCVGVRRTLPVQPLPSPRPSSPGAPAAALHLRGIPSGQLIRLGLRLESTFETPVVSERLARQVALGMFREASVRQIVLAQVRDPNVTSINEHLCWVLSVQPTGGASVSGANGNNALGNHVLVFVDAYTGEFLGGIGG